MMITEHSMIVLNEDHPVERLHAGDVGAVVHVYGEGDAFEVEFIDGAGSTIALITLAKSEIRPIQACELLHTRRRA